MIEVGSVSIISVVSLFVSLLTCGFWIGMAVDARIHYSAAEKEIEIRHGR